jgi:hypothetical protein
MTFRDAITASVSAQQGGLIHTTPQQAGRSVIDRHGTGTFGPADPQIGSSAGGTRICFRNPVDWRKVDCARRELLTRSPFRPYGRAVLPLAYQPLSHPGHHQVCQLHQMERIDPDLALGSSSVIAFLNAAEGSIATISIRFRQAWLREASYPPTATKSRSSTMPST